MKLLSCMISVVGVVIAGCSTVEDDQVVPQQQLGTLQQASVECGKEYVFGGTVKYTCSPQIKKAYLGGDDPTVKGTEITCPKPAVVCEVTEHEAPSKTCEAGGVPPANASYCSGEAKDFNVAAPSADDPIKAPCPDDYDAEKCAELVTKDKYALFHECEKVYLAKHRKDENDVSYLASLCVANAPKSAEKSLTCCKKEFVPPPPPPKREDSDLLSSDVVAR